MRTFEVNEAACEFRFVQASGPGGQHVNKTSTAVELRVKLERLGLSPGVLRRLYTQQRNRINKQGELIIQAEQFRSQLKNRKAAEQRLQAMLAEAWVQPKRRIPTRPGTAAKNRRISAKKQRSEKKAARRKPRWD